MIDFPKYEQLAVKLSSAANILWSKLTFITIAEVLNNETDLHSLDQRCSELMDRSSKGARTMSKEADSIPEEEYDSYSEEYDRIYDIYNKVDDKLFAIDTVLTMLRKLEETSQEDNFNLKFGDSSSIELSESISIIKIGRL